MPAYLKMNYVRKWESVLAEGAGLVDKHIPEIKKAHQVDQACRSGHPDLYIRNNRSTQGCNAYP